MSQELRPRRLPDPRRQVHESCRRDLAWPSCAGPGYSIRPDPSRGPPGESHRAANRAGENGQPIDNVLIDRGYSQLDPRTWQWPLLEAGIESTFDLKTTQRGPRPFADGDARRGGHRRFGMGFFGRERFPELCARAGEIVLLFVSNPGPMNAAPRFSRLPPRRFLSAGGSLMERPRTGFLTAAETPRNRASRR
jgi:hypothetical protein